MCSEDIGLHVPNGKNERNVQVCFILKVNKQGKQKDESLSSS
ncbi:hypothetical protein FM109_03280 [Vibrio casei]|nr:hypothetical protein FM109_03280 [Vibrio casei]